MEATALCGGLRHFMVRRPPVGKVPVPYPCQNNVMAETLTTEADHNRTRREPIPADEH